MITNEWIAGTGDLCVPHQVRREVFVKEQHVPEELETDREDRESMHLVIRDGDRPVAAGRIRFDGKTFRIERCAVLKDMRGQGFGDLLIKLLLRKVFEYEPPKVLIHAQKSAQGFYEKYGFKVSGDEFEEAGIVHVPMYVTSETLVFPSKCGSCPQPSGGEGAE